MEIVILLNESSAESSSCRSFLQYFHAAISNHMSEKPEISLILLCRLTHVHMSLAGILMFFLFLSHPHHCFGLRMPKALWWPYSIRELRHDKTCFCSMRNQRQPRSWLTPLFLLHRCIPSKFQTYSHLLWLFSPFCVGPGRKPRQQVFSWRGSYEGIRRPSVRLSTSSNEPPWSRNFDSLHNSLNIFILNETFSHTKHHTNTAEFRTKA